MMRNLPFVLGIAALLLVIVTNSIFVVRQDRQAIVLRFGAYANSINEPGTNEPGLYFKWPIADQVIVYDRRNIGLTLEGQPVTASDQERLIVDAIVRWRITDPRRFYQSALTEEGGAQRLETFTESAMRRALGGATSNDIISGRRAALMQEIEDDLNRSAATELGLYRPPGTPSHRAALRPVHARHQRARHRSTRPLFQASVR